MFNFIIKVCRKKRKKKKSSSRPGRYSISAQGLLPLSGLSVIWTLSIKLIYQRKKSYVHLLVELLRPFMRSYLSTSEGEGEGMKERRSKHIHTSFHLIRVQVSANLSTFYLSKPKPKMKTGKVSALIWQAAITLFSLVYCCCRVEI